MPFSVFFLKWSQGMCHSSELYIAKFNSLANLRIKNLIMAYVPLQEEALLNQYNDKLSKDAGE